MIKNWRERRRLSYIFNDFNDINLESVYNSLSGDELADQVVMFFESGSQLIYPAKSYFVAIVYAEALCRAKRSKILDVEITGINDERLSDMVDGCITEALDLPDLLPDDKYFKRYSEDRETYESIIHKLSLSEKLRYSRSLIDLKSVRPTLDYFCQEFMITKRSITNYWED